MRQRDPLQQGTTGMPKLRTFLLRATFVATILAATIAVAADEAPAPAQPNVEESTLTKVGQTAPLFSVPTLGGTDFVLADHKGQVVLVNWFATWCGPCKAEMPALKGRVWEKFGTNPAFAMVSVSRGEDAAKVGPFVKERGLPWTIGLDAGKAAYGLYAAAYIPRNYVIGRDGRIVYQSEGFTEEEFAAMIAVIEKELAAR